MAFARTVLISDWTVTNMAANAGVSMSNVPMCEMAAISLIGWIVEVSTDKTHSSWIALATPTSKNVMASTMMNGFLTAAAHVMLTASA